MAFWVPPRGTGAMTLHVQESEALQLTFGSEKVLPGVIRTDKSRGAAAVYAVAAVGPRESDPNAIGALYYQLMRLIVHFRT